MHKPHVALLALLAGVAIHAEPTILDIANGVNIQEAGDYVLRGTDSVGYHQIVVNATGKAVNLTLDNIEVTDTANDMGFNSLFLVGHVHLFLKGKNVIRSGGIDGNVNTGCALFIEHDTGSSLRIDDAPRPAGDTGAPGSLWLSGSEHFIHGAKAMCGGAAVIGSGEVHATGGSYNPAINSIRIEGGTLVAQGGSWGSGIDGDVVITGGNVTAIGGSWGAGIATSSVGNIQFYSEHHIRIEGGEVTALPGGLDCDGIGRQYSKYTYLDPCGVVEITGGHVHAGIPGYSGSEGGICADTLRISGGTVVADWIKSGHQTFTGGSFPISLKQYVGKRWNLRDSTYLLKMTGLPANTPIDSLHLDRDSLYGTNGMRTDSTGALCIAVPKGPLVGMVGLAGKTYPFQKTIVALDTNILGFDANLSVSKSTRADLFSATSRGDRIVLEGLRPGERVQVVRIDGQILSDLVSGSDRLSLPSPGPGMFLVRCGSKTRRVATFAK